MHIRAIIFNNMFNLRFIVYPHRFRTVFVVVSLMLVISACRPVRDVVTPVPDPDRLSVDHALASLRAAETSFDHFFTRFSGLANFQGSEYSIAGHIRIKKDSAIFVSIAPLLGIEIARVLLTPDSVKIVNRIDNTFFVGDYRYISSFLNTYADFHMLQALLVGNDFSHFPYENFTLSNDKNKILLQSNDRRPPGRGMQNLSFQQNLWLNNQSFNIEENLLYEPLTRRSLRARYISHAKVDDQTLPQEFMLVFTEPGMRASIDMRYSRTSLAGERPISFSIPSTYSPMAF